MTARIRRGAMVLGLVAWASMACAGMAALMASAYAPSAPADARPTWPAGLSIARSANTPTLVVCLHPRCPCSDATLDAVVSLLASAKSVNAYVLFAVPESATAEWADTTLVRRARTIAGVNVAIDAGGRQSAMLGARTSGQTFLYDAAGRLAFVGGLTPGRGETGDTPGAAVVAAALSNRPLSPTTFTSPVFGCALCRPALSEAVQ